MNFSLITLGCDKNRVDSEKIIFSLQQAGYILTEEAEAEFIVINTCAFIDKAKKEAIDTILSAAQYKVSGKLKKLIVTGCFAQRYAKDVDFPEVDLFLSIAEEKNIVEHISRLFNYEKICPHTKGRVLTTPPHYAYLKIADGCNNRCSYCAIPAIRGKYISTPIEELFSEAKVLEESGVKELILVAQDTTNYGKDIYGTPSLIPLLEKLSALHFWKIRLLYTYPELISESLLNYIYNNPKIAKYLDIPFQHIDKDILKSMNRRSDEDDIRKLVAKIRKDYPDIALRSSFIVGYPTETAEAHKKLVDFVSNALDYSGFFSYSSEEGTLAYKLKATQTKSTIKNWIKECEKAQVFSTINCQKRWLNKTVEVIYEGIDYKKQCFYGRTEQNAPDIDTYVYFTANTPIEIGKIYKINITEYDFHLFGKLVLED